MACCLECQKISPPKYQATKARVQCKCSSARHVSRDGVRLYSPSASKNSVRVLASMRQEHRQSNRFSRYSSSSDVLGSLQNAEPLRLSQPVMQQKHERMAARAVCIMSSRLSTYGMLKKAALLCSQTGQ